MKKTNISCIMGLVFCLGYAPFGFAMEVPQAESEDCKEGTGYHHRSCNGWSELTELQNPDAWDSASRNREPRHRWYGLGNKVAEGAMIQMILEGVQFDFDKSNLRADTIPILDRNVAKMQEMEFNRINVVGYTDSHGSGEYNQNLSEERAQAVKDYLVRNGIASSRITVEGRGESGAIAPNKTPSGKDSPSGRAKNRRAIELQIWTK
ncbi:MAG: OmpA family protein [Deltaproteobacteria bacterium]|nr:OmpA family protein [Deltaproteobacteria bacterium]